MKTCIFGLNWLGDAIMSLPAVHSAAEAAGEQVDVIARPSVAPVYKLLQSVNKVYSIDTRLPLYKLLPYFAAVRRRRYDRVIILPNSFRAAFQAFLCGGVRRGYAAERRAVFLSEAVEKPSWACFTHESFLHLALVKEDLLKEKQPTAYAPFPPIIKSRFENLSGIGRKLNLPDSAYAVIAPGAAFGDVKRWPAERFVAVGKYLRDCYGFKVVITGGTAEAELAHNIAESIGNGAIDLAGRTSLYELLHLLANTELLLCNDSGTMHAGALLNTPLVVPVGPTDMRRTGPMSENVVVVKGPSCPEGEPCRKKTCKLRHRICLDGVSVEAVISGVDFITASNGACVYND